MCLREGIAVESSLAVPVEAERELIKIAPDPCEIEAQLIDGAYEGACVWWCCLWIQVKPDSLAN